MAKSKKTQTATAEPLALVETALDLDDDISSLPIKPGTGQEVSIYFMLLDF